jgi:glycosyltransferase involved in cell wall biosynthesis
MKVLIVHSRYFRYAGPETYLFKIKEALKEVGGIEIYIYAYNFINNEDYHLSEYFTAPPSVISTGFYSTSNSYIQSIISMQRLLFDYQAYRSLNKYIKDQKIDIVYTINPSIFLLKAAVMAAKKSKIPIISRLSDFQMMCTEYHFFRNGKICEDCKNGQYNVVRNRCIRGSKVQSLGRYLSRLVEELLNVKDHISKFVLPSLFMKKKMIEFGFDESKLVPIRTYIEQIDSSHRQDSPIKVIYVGRLSVEKGIDLLLDAFSEPIDNVELTIIGGNSEYFEEISHRSNNYNYVGYKEKNEINKILSKSHILVCPSRWYENTPNVVLEGMAHGLAIIVNDVGSLPELVDGNGMVFECNSSEALRSAIRDLSMNKDELNAMMQRSRHLASSQYREQNHVEALLEVFNTSINDYRSQEATK